MSNNNYTFEVDSSSHVSNMGSAGAMAVDVNSGRAFTINGAGLVGIGLQVPQKTLDIASGTPTLRLTNTTDPLVNGTVGAFEFFTTDSSTNASRVLSSIVCDNLAGSSVPEGQLVFKTSRGGSTFTQATEKMRIDRDGKTFIKPSNFTAGQRTSPFIGLSVVSTYSGGDGQPYTGFGGGIGFSNETYNGTYYNSAGIFSAIGDNSNATTTGGSLIFKVSPTKSGQLTEAVRISPNFDLEVQGGIIGKNYPQTSTFSATFTSVIDTGIIPNAGVYEFYLVGNPNAQGSGAYASISTGLITIAVDYTGALGVFLRIESVVLAEQGGGSGNIQLTVGAFMQGNGTAGTTKPIAEKDTSQIRLLIGGYSGTIGANQVCRITRKV
tara:strand:- start:10 stop:1149 length:1140 start_codon:yes stop_codon:yes gene_type:complete